ncbi:MAG: FAD:protein FMN transferase, partial [Planctomycetaceae bacterium]|nr:FAD:protein FMN transferase [Planctomycetaceae bacterium]
VPSDDAIAKARERVGYRRLSVRLDPPALKKEVPDLELNLNAIAPGWAVDRLADLLAQHGLGNYMIDIGGEIRTGGRKSDGSSWRIGIERPADDAHSLQAAVPLDDASIATSGDYRNFYIVDGVRYSHTVDPRTGVPVRHGLASVSLIADDCTTADGLATALMVLGPDEGLQLAERLQLAAWMLIRSDEGTITARSSSAFQQGVGKDLVEFSAAGNLDANDTGPDAEHAPLTGGSAALAAKGEPAKEQSSQWLTLVLGMLGFSVAIVGLAMGLLLRGKPLPGSCGGLAGMKDEHGHPMCQSCTTPPEQCDEFRRKVSEQVVASDEERD